MKTEIIGAGEAAHPQGGTRKHSQVRWIPLAVAATIIGKLALLAQDWQTVDDFAPTAGDAEAHGVAIDAAGGIYVVGTANGHGIVRRSTDRALPGRPWTISTSQ